MNQVDIENQSIALQDYWLSRDRVRREIRPLYRFGYADLVAFAFYSAQGIESYESKNMLGY